MLPIHAKLCGQVSDIRQRQRIIRKIEDILVPLGAERVRTQIWCIIEPHPASAPRDSLVERALELMHADPLRPWSLRILSAQAGASRSSLTKRLASAMGCAPMHYLKRLRMLIAAERLTDRNAKIAAVAQAAGYDSEAAFSRAFKRFAGCAPGQWRWARSEDRASGLDAARNRQSQVWTIEQEIAPNDHSRARDFRIPTRLRHDDICFPPPQGENE